MARASKQLEARVAVENALAEAATGALEPEAEYLERNRRTWHRWGPRSATVGAEGWQASELQWGLWNTPESRLGLLLEVEPAADVIELGCGAGALCAWLKRGGRYPVGVDYSEPQLMVAEQLQKEYGVYFPLIRGDAETLPYDRESFDLAISEYGPSVWSNPRHWLPEAHRVLRLGGQLVFFTNPPLLMACTPSDGSPAGTSLVRDYFSHYRIEFGDDAGVEFHLTHGQWVRLLRACGFAVENLIELQPDAHAESRYKLVPLEWARRWPSEEIWVARKVSLKAPLLELDPDSTRRGRSR